MHLAEFGVRVVRVDGDQPSDKHDHPLWLYANRNKQRVPAAEGLVAQLLSKADVAVVDRTPARLATEHLTSEQLRARTTPP